MRNCVKRRTTIVTPRFFLPIMVWGLLPHRPGLSSIFGTYGEVGRWFRDTRKTLNYYRPLTPSPTQALSAARAPSAGR